MASSIDDLCSWKKADTAKALASRKLDKLFAKQGIGASAEELFGEVPKAVVHAGDVHHRKPLLCDARGHGIYILDGSLTVDGTFTFYTADAYTILVITGDLVAHDLVQAWDTQLVVLGTTTLSGLLYLDLSDAGFAMFRGPVTSRERHISVGVEGPMFAKAPKGMLLDRWSGPTDPPDLHAALVRGDSLAPPPAPKKAGKPPSKEALARMSVAEALTVTGFEKMMFEGEKVNPNWFVKGRPGCAVESVTLGAVHLPAFPAELASLKELVLLHLGDERQLAAMLRTLPVLRSLTRLRISSCALTALPAEVGELPSLETLELSGNRSLASLPAAAINKLGKLSTLVVESNAIAKLPAGLDLDRIPRVTFDEPALALRR